MFVELPSGDVIPVDAIKMVLQHPTTETRRMVRIRSKEDPISVISFFRPKQKKGSLMYLDGGLIVLVPVVPKIIVNRINKVLGMAKNDIETLKNDFTQEAETAS